LTVLIPVPEGPSYLYDEILGELGLGIAVHPVADGAMGLQGPLRMPAGRPRADRDGPRRPISNCHSARKTAFGLRSTF
jgi:hypothetical protein